MKKIEFDFIIRTVKNINTFLFKNYTDSKTKVRLCMSPRSFQSMFNANRDILLFSPYEKSRIATLCLYSVLRARESKKVMFVVNDYTSFDKYEEFIEKIEDALHIPQTNKVYLKLVPSNVLRNYLRGTSFLQRIDEVVIDDCNAISECIPEMPQIIQNIVNGGHKLVLGAENSDSNDIFSSFFKTDEIINDKKFLILNNSPEYAFLHDWFIKDKKIVSPLFEIAVISFESTFNSIDLFSIMCMNFPVDFKKLKKFDSGFIKDRIPDKFFSKLG